MSKLTSKICNMSPQNGSVPFGVNMRRVVADGVEYDAIGACAKAHKISEAEVRDRIASEEYIDWFFPTEESAIAWVCLDKEDLDARTHSRIKVLLSAPCSSYLMLALYDLTQFDDMAFLNMEEPFRVDNCHPAVITYVKRAAAKKIMGEKYDWGEDSPNGKGTVVTSWVKFIGEEEAMKEAA